MAGRYQVHLSHDSPGG